MIYDGPLEAPIAQGEQVAELLVSFDDLPDRRIPLVAETAVEAGGVGSRLKTAAAVLWRKSGAAEMLGTLPIPGVGGEAEEAEAVTEGS